MHGFSEGAIAHLKEALQRGNGTAAQFSHPELGGMGQWMNGMLMIGDGFNAPLKARVAALIAELTAQPSTLKSPPKTEWPAEWGAPSQSSAQNELRYAYFPKVARLAVISGPTRLCYDTTGIQVTGISMSNGILVLSTTQGTILPSSLPSSNF